MKRKYTWQWLLCFLFISIACLLPTDTAKAAVEYAYSFDVVEQVYYIQSVKGDTPGEEILLPTTFQGYPVVGIKQCAFYNEANVKKVVVPQSYTYIEPYAFYMSSGLQEVELNANIKTLPSYTFCGCQNLEKITLPNTIKRMEIFSIVNCGIKKLTIPKSVTNLEAQAIESCDKLEELIIKGQIKTLKPYAIRGEKLTKLELPSSLKKIEQCAFAGTALKKITIPKNVKTIDANAFWDCSKLYQVVFKGSKVTIDTYAFNGLEKNKITIVADENSEAYEYAQGNGFLASESTKFKVVLNGKKMFVGEKKQLLTYNNPHKITWKTSNKKVVAIDKDGYITAKKKGTATITAKINGKKYKYKITVVKRTVDNVLNIVWSNYVTKDMTDYEKIVAANKWLAQNVKYDMRYYEGGIPFISHRAEGALEKGLAVCDGYAYAYQKIIDHYGIENKIVYGDSNNGSGTGWEGHAWNIVKIGTRWYHVDVTWNDPVGDHLTWDYVRDDYLLLSNAKIDDDHRWVKKQYPTASKKAPDKTITTVNKNGLKISAIEKELKVGKKATLKVTGTKKKVTWSSSNSKIVKVDKKGKITAKKKGTATIYFKVDGKKYAVKVTVTK